MKLDKQPLLDLAVLAGKAILSVYNDQSRFGNVSYKEDDSPLTLADQLSHQVIAEGLGKLYPEIPLLSEEGAHLPYESRKDWNYFWCVDPLDGTKEFINRNDEFTVNIALIHKDTPVFGLIYVPCQDLLYYGDAEGSFMQVPGSKAVSLHVDQDAQEWVAVGSRSHSDPSERSYLSQFPVTSQSSAGSSLKFCLVAKGQAHIYYRKGPTMEWDTAAGHAIARYSGAIFSTPEGEPFLYNKESLRNGSFVCRIATRGELVSQ